MKIVSRRFRGVALDAAVAAVLALLFSSFFTMSATPATPIETGRSPVLVTSTAGDGRLRDVQVIRTGVDKDVWLTEFPTDPGVLLANNPAVTDSGRYMLVPTQGRSHGLWLTNGRRAKLVDMSHLGWPAAVGDSETFIWPVDPVLGDGRPQVHFVRFDPASFAREPLANSTIDDVEWVRGLAVSPDQRWLLALVQRASVKGKTDAVLLDLSGQVATRVIASSNSSTDLVGPVSFALDGSGVTFVHVNKSGKEKNASSTSQVFYDAVAGSELARWAGAYSGAWWGGQWWALRSGGKKTTELISSNDLGSSPSVVRALRQDLGDVRFVSSQPNEITQWPKSPAVASLDVSQAVVPVGTPVTFDGIARSRDIDTHPVNATRAGWLQARNSDGKWRNVRYDKSGRVTTAIDAAGEYRWCSRIDFVLRDACSDPVSVVLN